MKVLLAAVALVAFVSPSQADLVGSSVALLLPDGPIDPLPPQAIRCRFAVQKDSLSNESIVGIWIEFPQELRPLEWTMRCDEIEQGRPDFSGTVEDHTALWAENDPLEGGIHIAERTEIEIYIVADVLLPPGFELPIHWWLVGGGGNDVCGDIQIYTPVDSGSWGAIKSRFRASGRPGLPG